MCNPAAAAMSFQVIEGVYNYGAQEKAAKQQLKLQEANGEATSKAVQRDLIRRYSALGRRDEESRQSAALQIRQLARDAAVSRGQARAAAGASGVEGGALNDIVRDFETQELLRIDVIEANRTSEVAQMEDQKESLRAQGEQTIFNSLGGPVQRPSIFGALLQIAGDVAGGYNEYNSQNPPDPSTGD